MSFVDNLIYQFFRKFLYTVANIFFSHIEIIGEDRVPKKGATIFVGNHANQFVDAILLATHTPREIGFLIAAKSLTQKVVGFFARALKSIPVERPQDVAKNGTGGLTKILIEKTNEGKKIIKLFGKGTCFTKEVFEEECISISASKNTPKVDKIISDEELIVKFEFDQPFETLLADHLKKKKTDSIPFKIFPKLDQNQVYKYVWDKLLEGGSIGIFPEGGSHDQTRLLDLKAGVTIMALGALEKNPELELKIVACGLNYVQGHRFRSHVFLEYGEPYTIPKEMIELYKKDKRKACSDLLDVITEKLKNVTLNFDDWESMQVVQMARRLYSPEKATLSKKQYLDLMKNFAIGYEKLKNEKELVELKGEVLDYITNLKTMGLKDFHLSSDFQLDQRSRRFIFYMQIIYFMVILIVGMPGFVLNVPIAGIAKFLAEKEAKKAKEKSLVKVEGKDVIASYKIVVSFVLTPVLYFLYSLVVLYYYGFKLSVLFFCFFPLFSYASLIIIEEGVAVWKSSFPLFISMFASNYDVKLKKLREQRAELKKKIRTGIEELLQRVPELSKNRVIQKEQLVDDESSKSKMLVKRHKKFVDSKK